MAATSSPPATLSALDVLRAGGNAVDAAVTAAAVLCVCEPHMTGIGGDCFAIVGEPDGAMAGLNGSGRSSRHADGDWLAASGLDQVEDTVHAVTVPGAVDAWQTLLTRFGTMDLAEALKPAIALAEAGVAVGPRTAHDWAGNRDRLAGDEGARLHLLKSGQAPRAGEIITFPALAATLKTIAAKGRDGFYTGENAEEIISVLAARGGLLDLEDLAATQATWVDPITTGFAGRLVCELPPNGVGLTALIALNILKRFELARYGPDSAERWHLEIEAMRLAWVLRNRHIADPDMASIPVDELLGDKLAETLAGRIDINKALPDAGGAVPMTGSDTVYLCVVDKDRLAVSFINSLFHGFGSNITTPRGGVTLQSRGAGFVVNPDHPNCIGPAKRPLHTILPGMAHNGNRIEMPFGVMGGPYQPMGHTSFLINRLIYGMDPQAALDFPRAFHLDGVTGIECHIPDSVASALTARGHVVAPVEEPLGGGQAIVIDARSGTLVGGSDPRKDGLALGY